MRQVKTIAMPVRFPVALLKRADAMAKVLSQRACGARVTRAEVIRLAIAKGLPLLTAILLLASCGGAASAEPSCLGRPAFTESTCWDPGGGVTRCQAQDGSYWDKQPGGHVVHWRQDSAPPAYTVICEEDS